MANTESLGFNYRGKAWNDGEKITRVSQPDGTVAEGMASLGYVWDASGSQWVKVPGDALNGIKVQITAGGAGGGAMTVADGADVAQGTTTDNASASTVIGILKAIKASVAGTLATSRTWVLSSGTDSVNVGNFPASQVVSGTVAVSSEPSDAAIGAAISAVVKVIGGYDPNTGTVKALKIQNVNGDDQLLVYDGRVRDELSQINQTLIEIRDLLRGV